MTSNRTQPRRIIMAEALPYHGAVQVGAHHYARAFMVAGWQVLWLGFPYHALSAIKSLGQRTRGEAASMWRQGPQSIGDRGWHYHPITALPFRDVPGLRSPAVLRTTLKATVPPVAEVVARLGFSSPDLLWLGQTTHALASLDTFPADRVLYRMSDDYAQFQGIPKAVQEAEAELLERADVVVTTAASLRQKLPPHLHSKAQCIPNGVVPEHFGGAAGAQPGCLQDTPKPRAVFVGTVGEWVDLELIANLAQLRPTMHFLIVGPATVSTEAVEHLPNVSLTGPIPYEQVPALLHHCDVGLLPFVRSELTDHVNPVKVYEYAAADLPMVCSPLPELQRMGAPCLYANDANTFAEAIDSALVQPTDPRRGQFARANSWASRFAELELLIGLQSA